ncbi:MAG: M28 family peptidase [Candidatus Eisenbacteria bacterium]|nr:M28 family peptidase [Candidatus Eisenbacteria bacterium]
MPTRRDILRLAETLTSAPTVSYREHEVMARIRTELDRVGIPYASDRWGNLIARYRGPRPRGRPVAFTAHMDHPGLVVTASRGDLAVADWYGGVQPKYFAGARVRVETSEGPVRGRVLSCQLAPTGRVSSVRLRLARPVPVGSVGGWDLVPFRLDGPWLKTKSADDLLGCAAVLSLMRDLSAQRPPITVYGVFTRAEEVGLFGASALAQDRALPQETAVIVIETSKQLPCGQLGKGVIVRVGDRRSVFHPTICHILRDSAELLRKSLRGFEYQRCLMDGGFCEATPFQAFGYAAGGLALALGNYHNMGPRRIAEEYVHKDDFWSLCCLLPAAAERLATAIDPHEAERRDFRRKLAPAREKLLASRSLPPPEFKKETRRRSRSATAALVLAAALASLPSSLPAATSEWRDARIEEACKQPGARAIPASRAATEDPRDSYDAQSYDLSLRVDPVLEEIEGVLVMRLRAVADLAEIVLDLAEGLGVDSVAFQGASCAFSRPQPDRLTVHLPSILGTDEEAVLRVRYGGRPGEGYFSGFEFFSKHGSGSTEFPVVSTLSQPNGSHTWWPCKESMSDKALATLSVEMDPAFEVAGVGDRVRSERVASLRRTTWQTRYPIAPFLLSFSATDYAAWEESFLAADGDSIRLQFYAFPEDSAKAAADFLPAVVDRETSALAAFENRFGPYPFRDRAVGWEKLGIAEVPWGALAMEHQTCVSLGNRFLTGNGAYAWAIAHEIAHQWWGDAVTPASMDDIWLSEGFATFCEAVYAEHLGGRAAYDSWLKRPKKYVPVSTDDLQTSLVSPDPAYWFLQSLTYNKGAWVLRMLREELGDRVFFASLNRYLDRHLHASATTNDFIRAVEETAGRDLRAFFIPWLYGRGRPVIAWDWWPSPSGEGHAVRLYIEQTQDGPIYPRTPPYDSPSEAFAFTLPIRIEGDGERVERKIPIWRRTETALLDGIPFAPRVVTIDPDTFLLRVVLERGAGFSTSALRSHPNPSRGETEIYIRGSAAGPTSVAIHDAAGRLVRRLESVRGEGIHRVRWDGESDAGERVASGHYFARSNGPGGGATARISVIR